MDSQKIKELNFHLAKAQENFQIAKGNYLSIKGFLGQHGYSISVANISIPIAKMDRSDYSAKLIRGREMMHLGALKALESIMDYAEEQVKIAEQKLRDEVNAI